MQQIQTIDRRSGGRPVYRQLSRILIDEIQKYYMTGDMLPAEQALAKRFQVNRHTVRRAVGELIKTGWVDRIHGKGVKVLKVSVDYTIHRGTRFTETLESQGRRTVSRVLDKCCCVARGKVARKLALPQGAPVAYLQSMRIVDTSPFCISSHFFPSPEYDFILDNYTGGSLHRFISDRCGKRLKRISSLIRAAQPSRPDQRLLNMPEGIAVLSVRSVNVERITGLPVEYVETQFRGDAIQLSVKP
ncbi:MAG: phosphonate metabolism transcriptional regulator PhnF [Desulfobacteraceae bacterium]|jgi:GntR family phosphonate transport system transcriptional regulator